MESIYSKTLSQLEEEMLALNQKKFRATQIYTWIYQKKVLDFNLMSDISLKFIPILNEKYSLELPKRIQTSRSPISPELISLKVEFLGIGVCAKTSIVTNTASSVNLAERIWPLVKPFT